MPILKENRFIIIFITICMIFYLGLLCLLNGTGIYNMDKSTNNDRFFSLDDVYYTTSIYSVDMENSLRIVKHPLFMVFGNAFAKLEKALLGNISMNSHYILIVLMQIMVQMLTLTYLYKILSEFYRVDRKLIFILLAIYAFSVSALIYTFFSESYIFSGAALVMSYYFILKRKVPVSILLGVIVTGITITNFVIWAIMILLLIEGIRRKVLMVFAAVAAFTSLVYIFPVGRMFFSKFFFVFGNSPRNYSDTYGLYAMAKRTIYSIFGTTVFYVDTVNQSPFGEFPGKAISFVPGSNILIIAMMLLWISLLVYSTVKNYRNKLLFVPLAILIFNILFHGVIQYGLKEAFLYSLHHLFAQVLIVAAAFLPTGKEPEGTELNRISSEGKIQSNKARQAVFAILVIFFAGEILLNLQGYRDFYHYVLTLV